MGPEEEKKKIEKWMKWVRQIFVTYHTHFLPLMQMQIMLEAHEAATIPKVTASVGKHHRSASGTQTRRALCPCSLAFGAGLAATADMSPTSVFNHILVHTCHVSSLIYHPSHSIRRIYTES